MADYVYIGVAVVLAVMSLAACAVMIVHSSGIIVDSTNTHLAMFWLRLW